MPACQYQSWGHLGAICYILISSMMEFHYLDDITTHRHPLNPGYRHAHHVSCAQTTLDSERLVVVDFGVESACRK
jgi:hypothetical protein